MHAAAAAAAALFIAHHGGECGPGRAAARRRRLDNGWDDVCGAPPPARPSLFIHLPPLGIFAFAAAATCVTFEIEGLTDQRRDGERSERRSEREQTTFRFRSSSIRSSGVTLKGGGGSGDEYRAGGRTAG